MKDAAWGKNSSTTACSISYMCWFPVRSGRGRMRSTAFWRPNPPRYTKVYASTWMIDSSWRDATRTSLIHSKLTSRGWGNTKIFPWSIPISNQTTKSSRRSNLSSSSTSAK